MMVRRAIKWSWLVLAAVWITGFALPEGSGGFQPAVAQVQGQVPGAALGGASDAEMWRAIRHGVTGTVSIRDKKAGMLVQADGDKWRDWRTGPVSRYGARLLGGVLLLLMVFYVLRGRIDIDHGPAGRRVTRFVTIERFAHWLTASSFIVLGLTGLNILYGKSFLMPLIGQETFAALTYYGKFAHNYIGFAFIVGIVLMAVIWLRDNLPDRYDLLWLLKGGGLFVKGVHPKARKFNAGQKLIFWSVIVLGGSLSFSGITLMFPFQITPFAETFQFLNLFGAGLPTELTVLQEIQYSQMAHSIGALVLIAVILAHIYIGSAGMVGAFDAVWTGEVDENWLREHHSVWADKILGQTGGQTGTEAEAGDD